MNSRHREAGGVLFGEQCGLDMDNLVCCAFRVCK